MPLFRIKNRARAGERSRRGAQGKSRRTTGRLLSRLFCVVLVLPAALAGCTVKPEPLTTEQTALRVKTDLAQLNANQPSLDGPLTLHGAMAHALLHNLDARVEAMEQSLAMRELGLARLGLLPGLSARYDAGRRSNVQASSSRSVRTGRESLSASTSSDRTRLSGNLGAVWHVLDFGVSWYGAKQQSDRALIAYERRRKAVHGVLAEIRRAWWRAVAGERALVRLEPLLARVREALGDSARLAARQIHSPVEALRYQRTLLKAVEELERQRRESRLAKIELASLVGLSPGTDFALAMPPTAPEPRELTFDIDELAALALAHRPELREEQLGERIAVFEVKKAMLRLLPGLELTGGAYHDRNSFLVNNDWLSLGAAVSANLTGIFTAPAAIDTARARRELAVARREALSMAVLTQLYAALASFEEARERHKTADKIADIERRILGVLRSSKRFGTVGRLRTIRAEIDALRALLARDLRLAEIEESFGRIFLAAGADILPVEGVTTAGVAGAIKASEAAWSRGDIAIQPWRELTKQTAPPEPKR